MTQTLLHHRSTWSLDSLSGDELSTLIDTALALKHSSEAGTPQQPLRGKNIAVMCESPDDPALHGFTSAASALGARVAHIRPSSSRITQPGRSQDTVNLLGRLYDAIECEGLPMSVVKEVERGAGRPVFNGVAQATHPLRVLGDLLTMRQHSGKPLRDITLRYVGDPSSPAANAWRRSAALTGLSLRIASPGELNDSAQARAAAADFVWDEGAPRRCRDGRIELACTCNPTHSRCLDRLGDDQVANQQYALQALLCSTVV